MSLPRALMLIALYLGCLSLGVAAAPAPVWAEKGHDSQQLRLQSELEKLQKRHGVASISVALLRDHKLWLTAAAGLADAPAKAPAHPNTLYLLASCSKPVIGLAVAKLLELQPAFDLDADINTYLKWPEPIEHPDHPDTPVTMRHLLLHRSGLTADADIDLPDYPRPDPSQPLDAFLRAQLADDDLWEASAPGASEVYSNLGAALAALVVEKASGQDFKTFCNTHLFDPLGLKDVRWTLAELSEPARARVAKPHDADGADLGHYGFNDYPSGLLRASAPDFAKLWAAVASGGAPILKPQSVKLFEDVPMLIGRDGGAFSHSGGEAGVNTYFVYRKDGTGYVYLINSDAADEDTEDALGEDLEQLLDGMLR